VGFFSILRTIFGAGEPETEPAPADGETSAAVERRARERLDAKDGTRALIIDDSRTVVAALGKILRSGGFVTMEAMDAESGVELARTLLPELIFLDIVLPGMNGFSALRVLRKDSATRDIPVIMMSGNEQATEQFFGTRIGADDFMKKPFSRTEVFARIEKLLDGNLVPRRRGGSNNLAEIARTTAPIERVN
jgi:twitching motility two-component system response regulator PilH